MIPRLKICYWYSGVYSIRNRRNGKHYIGSSSNIEDRIKQHKRDLERGAHINSEMQKDYNERDNFDVMILYCEPIKKNGYGNRRKIFKIEKSFIEKYDSINNGYNKSIPYAPLKFESDTDT